MSQRRSGKNCDSAQRQRQRTCESTGPPRTSEPTSGHRTTNRSPQNSRAWSKQDENRHGRFDLQLSVCSIVEFESSNAEFGRKSNECGASMLKTEGDSDNGSAKLDETLRRSAPQDTFLAGKINVALEC
jgi:hypothetical protein